jgi:hypothetical protein
MRKEKAAKVIYMGVDAVRLKMVRKCSKAQFVEDTTLVDAEIVLNFTVAPVGEVLGIIVNLRTSANSLRQRW